jgi:hypothetical protein
MKQKGHHYITESYQKNFADKNGHVWILTPEKRIYNTNPENSFKKSNFYTVKLPSGGGSLVVEKTLAEIEGGFISVIKNKIVLGKDLDDEDRMYLSLFVAAMITRTKIQRDHFKDNYNKLIKRMEEMGEMMKKNPPKVAHIEHRDSPSLTLDELKLHIENFDSDESVSTLGLLQDTAPLISQMKWSILCARSSKFFISSDNPFCMCAPKREQLYGKGTMGASAGLLDGDVELTFPLSREYVLFASWESKRPLYVNVEEDVIEQVNYRTCRTASNLIAGSKQELEEIIKKVTSNVLPC